MFWDISRSPADAGGVVLLVIALLAAFLPLIVLVADCFDILD